MLTINAASCSSIEGLWVIRFDDEPFIFLITEHTGWNKCDSILNAAISSSPKLNKIKIIKTYI